MSIRPSPCAWTSTGTLVPIQSRPELCWLSSSQKDLLRSQTRPRVRVLRSSRVAAWKTSSSGFRDSRDHLRREPRSGDTGSPQGVWGSTCRSHTGVSAASLVPLEKILQLVAGCWVEDKGLSVTVHFRGVMESDIPLVLNAVEDYVIH